MLGMAGTEWEKIRSSLSACGDIGDFDESIVLGNTELDEDELADFMSSLADFVDVFEEHGYQTLEAMGVYVILARYAASRLGLRDIIARAFANGYTFIRTGWALDTDTSMEQNIFYKMFFRSREDSDWEFGSQEVRDKLKLVYDKYLSWEKDRDYYRHELREYLDMKKEEAEEAD